MTRSGSRGAGARLSVVQAILAALTFGLGAPIAKLLLASVSPLVLAGLLYLGAGLFVSGLRLLRVCRLQRARVAVRADWWLLGAAVLAGGVLAPPLLLWGLARSPASGTALLLNLEVAFTALLARAVFREHLGGRVAAAALLVAAGGISLSWTGADARLALPSLAVAAACLFWALDNNLTRLAAGIDAIVLAQAKGLIAGVVNLVLALSLAHTLPPWPSIFGAFGLGAISYGCSLVLFILAMRGLGAARAAVYFALGPFFGAASAVLLLGEGVSPRLLAAAALMGSGAWLLLRERHEHVHRHEAKSHGHRHVHDEHHQHTHGGWEGPEPHTHPHVTGAVEHSHPHVPDQDHWHGHD